MNASATNVAAVSSTTAAILSSLHFGTLATVASVIMIGFVSGIVAHLVTRREAVRQTREIVEEAVKRHVDEMHKVSDKAMQEAAGYRPDRT
ncbi:hypothetical protein ACFPOB_27290 [Bosea eneae]|uniref:Uncharacterized protein n=1 Tax=Bosea eneae TaxID=151454 RepID=A0ABW0IZ14_9HYPH